MTNREKFIEVFGDNPQRHHITKSWWDEEYVPPQEPCGDVNWIDNKCSICGKGIEDLIDSREWYKNETPNYCPFCGERVVERSEE